MCSPFSRNRDFSVFVGLRQYDDDETE